MKKFEFIAEGITTELKLQKKENIEREKFAKEWMKQYQDTHEKIPA
jgi:hypothetical protein